MFKEQPILRHKTIGEQLHAARESTGKTTRLFAEQLRISEHHLDALERGRYNDLPSPVYIKHYIRLYAEALEIPWRRLQEQYEQEIRVYHTSQKKERKTNAHTIHTIQKKRKERKQRGSTVSLSMSDGHSQRALVIYHFIKIAIVVVVVLGLVIYVVWGIARLFSPPPLHIVQPDHDLIVTESSTTISGITAPEMTVTINEQRIAVDPKGYFSANITLREGLNTIRIAAKTKLSQERVIMRNILY
ncbi:MAG TPA: helix-turn-helix domain-containing protein, partial [Patescibacteria group bacterium]|nr:helix-turn-helix domain-containing protein [Patescibacteria group bacterium]